MTLTNTKEKRKNIGRRFLIASFFLLVFLPMTMTFAQNASANPDENGGMQGISYFCKQTPAVDANGNTIPGVMLAGNCTFTDLVSAVQNISKFIVVNVALPFSVIIIIWAGWLLLTSGDNAGKRKEARDMFEKLAWGIFWVLGAWLVITMITNSLVSGSITPLLK